MVQAAHTMGWTRNAAMGNLSRTADGAVQRYRVAQAHATSRTRDAAMGNLSNSILTALRRLRPELRPPCDPDPRRRRRRELAPS